MPHSKLFALGRRIAVLAALSGFAAGGMAQSLSSRPVTLVVGFGAGSGADVVARLIAEPLARQLGTAVVIDNKPGVLGQLAVSQVRRSVPDGHTLLLGDAGAMVLYPLAKKPAPFDPLSDFIHISQIADTGIAFIVPAQRGYKSAKEFAAAQQKKDKAMLVTVALGMHAATSLFAEAGNFKFEPIQFRNPGEIIPAIVTGDTDGGFVTASFASTQIAGGRVAALMQTGSTRSKLLPNVPTVAEAGFGNVMSSAWLSLVAPVGTPPSVVQQLYRGITTVLKDPALRQRIEETGFIPAGSSSPDEMRERISKELNLWKPVVERSDIRVP